MSLNRNESQFIGPGFGSSTTTPGGLLDGLKFDQVTPDKDSEPLKIIWNYLLDGELQATIEVIYESEFRCKIIDIVKTFDIRNV